MRFCYRGAVAQALQVSGGSVLVRPGQVVDLPASGEVDAMMAAGLLVLAGELGVAETPAPQNPVEHPVKIVQDDGVELAEPARPTKPTKKN